MARHKSVTKTDVQRALSTALDLGLVVSKIVLKDNSVELIFGDVDQPAETINDRAAPKEW